MLLCVKFYAIAHPYDSGIVHEKAIKKMGATVADNRSKTCSIGNHRRTAVKTVNKTRSSIFGERFNHKITQ